MNFDSRVIDIQFKNAQIITSLLRDWRTLKNSSFDLISPFYINVLEIKFPLCGSPWLAKSAKLFRF